MTNKEIASIFSRIADMLEIKDENVFRIRAYRTASQNVTGLARQLEDMYAEDPESLGNVPGIGKDLKEKIIEMIKTNRLAFYAELMKEFSPGFLDMLSLSGMGPKKLKKLKDELGINNMNDLEKACKEKKLENLEGMGAKTEEKLLEAIEHFRRQEGRMLLPEADAWANEVISYLKKSKNFKKIEKAGSLRRGKETVGDLDILSIAKDSAKAMDHFTSYKEAENIIAKGPTKSSVSLKEGPQVDLRVIDSSCFGAALVYFTGSKEHNIKLRTMAKAKGLKVNEYGVFSVGKTGKETFVAGRTEEEVYKRIGMQYIPPEMRENQGEIEAALKGKLPEKLIEMKDLKGDLHMHTTETDGRATLEEVVSRCKEKGYEYIAITDHSKNVRVARGMDEKRLLKQAERVRKIAKKTKDMKVLIGVEVDILGDGKLDLSDSALKELDIVIAAVHSKFTLDKEKQTSRMLKAMDNKYVNVLAHPSGRLITKRNPLQLDFDRLFEKAKENNIFLEINTHGERIDLNDVHIRRAKEMENKFLISSDAHDLSHLEKIVYGVITARRGWLKKEDVLNTYSLEKVRKLLKR